MPDDPSIQQSADRRALFAQREGEAVDQLRAFTNTGSPTNAQVIAAVKLLCRLVVWRWRLEHHAADSTD